MSPVELGLEGRVAIVTGGGSGIGRAVVERLLQCGARVAVLDLVAGSSPAERERMELACDVTRPADVQSALDRVRERWGGPDLLVQSAGVTRDGVLWKLGDEAWEHVLDVNLTGAFRVLRAVAPLLRERGGGSVVHVASINGLRGKFGQANYSASKAGLIALTKTAARELGAFGVRVNAVAPGMVRTPMTETLPADARARAVAESLLGRIAEPEDVADAILFLLSDLARFVTGTTLRVDGGQCT